MHCLHYITLHYTALHCTALHCIVYTLHYIITYLRAYMHHIRPLSPPPCYIQTFDKQNQADCMSRPPLRQTQVASTRPSCNFTQEKVISKWLTSARVYSPNMAAYIHTFLRYVSFTMPSYKEIDLHKALGKCPAVHGIKSAGVCNLPSTAF